MAKILGIDLGTTNSCMAVMQGGQPKVISNAQGHNTTPSVVAVTTDGQRIVGSSAKNQAALNSSNTLYSVKRLIGRNWEDKEVQKAKGVLPFEIRKDSKGGVEVKMADKWYKPQEISAMVLQKLKQDAEQYFGETITEAVITVPAYFDDSQRQATKDAGKVAGFDVKRIVNEPTAAALAYGLDKTKEGKIAVFDLGGGTFDVSVLEIGDGVFEVLSTNGDTFLGGDDFDQALIDLMVKEFKDQEGIDLSQDNNALQRLKEAAEKAKIELSQSEETTINIPYITADAKGPKNLMRKLTRSEFEKLVSDLLDRLTAPCTKAISDAKLNKNDIQDVILVGGMTRMPAVRQKAAEIFGKEPKQDLNPDEVVAMGAAVQGGVLSGDVTDITLLDVTPLSLGVETQGGVMTALIERNTTIPAEKKQTFTTPVDSQTTVEVHILQGERPMAADNKSLGKFLLEGIPPAPRGVPQIEVTFAIDANGILKVTAKDKATGKEQQVTITASTTLSDDEVNRLVEEAKKHADDDKKRKETAEIRNNADSLTFTTEKTLRELKDKADPELKKQAEDLVKEIRDLLAKDDFDTTLTKQKTDELMSVLQKIGEKAYQSAPADADKNQDTSSKEQKDEGSDAKDTSDGKKTEDKSDDEAKSGEVVT